MDCKSKCYICVDFKKNVGHETKWCPKNICKKCGQNGHTKMDCMADFENFPLPNEILHIIFGYLNLNDQIQWSRVCKRFQEVFVVYLDHKLYIKGNDKYSFTCNGCMVTFSETQYHCMKCDDFDLCSACYSSNGKIFCFQKEPYS